MQFKSAVDWWYYLVAIGVPIIALLSSIYGNNPRNLILTAIALLISLLPIWLLFSTNYRIDSENLRIRSGPFVWVIPLNQIQSVSPSKSLLSAPALSLKRIRIDYGNSRSILVSPQNRDGFLQAIGKSLSSD